MAVQVEAERRHASFHAREAVELDVLRHAGEEALAERALVPEHRVPAERRHVVDRRDEAGEKLVLARAELEAVTDGLVRGRPDLVRTPRLEQLALAEREAHVRAEVLVRRADEDVDIPRRRRRSARAARSGRRRPRRGRRPMGELDDPAHVRSGTDRVRCDGERYDARAIRQLVAPGRRSRARDSSVRPATRARRRPMSCAISSHGETFASWSRAVRRSRRPRAACARTRGSGGSSARSCSGRRRSRPASSRGTTPAVSCATSTSSTVRMLVS